MLVAGFFPRSTTALSLFLLSYILVSCQPKEVILQPYTGIESPVIANDISNQKITAITEDEQGYIWLGSFRGLNKYNVREYH